MLKHLIVLAAAAVVALSRPESLDQVDPRCPADQSHFLLPHEWDCTLFYYCEYGVKRELVHSCALGTDFSFKLQVCIHPELANCDLPNVPPTDAPETSTTTTEQPTTTTEQPTTTTKQPTTTTEQPTTTTEQPTTTTEQPTTTTEQPTTTTEQPTTTTEQPTTEEITTTTQEPTTPDPTPQPEEVEIERLPNGCPADFSIHYLLPHETECHLFYYCENGEVFLRECASGLYFNPEIQVCDWPENVDCESKPIEVNKCKEECHIGDWAHDDCDKYWRCEGEDQVLGVCAEGLHFNENTKTCDFICNANCIRETVQVTREEFGVRIFVPADSSVASIIQAVRRAL